LKPTGLLNMDPALASIVEANARLLRYVACEDPTCTANHSAELKAQLNAVCERALQDLMPAVHVRGQQQATDVGAFMRFLMRSIDLRERLSILERAHETDALLACARAPNLPPRPTRLPACDHLPVVLAHLGAPALPITSASA